jgi:hypothetical protein
MGYTVRAWRFTSPLSLGAMLARINESAREQWAEGDSDSKDYIGGALTTHTVGRIYDARSHYVAHARHYAKGLALPWQIGAGEREMLERVLPLVQPQGVAPCEPFE